MSLLSVYPSDRTATAFTLKILAGVALCTSVHAQLLHPANGDAPSFEVAAVKPNHTAGQVFWFRLLPGRFMAENAPLNRIIRFAYNAKTDDEMVNMPGWAASASFDIDAKIGDAQVEAMKTLSPDERFQRYQLMLQSLLIERFRLKVSTQMKELKVYALIVAKDGPHLTAADIPPEQHTRRMPNLSWSPQGELKAGAVSMPFFTEWLSGKGETGYRVVIDATGLQGIYDFTLNWTPEDNRAAQNNAAGAGPAGAAPQPDSSAPSFFTALQEQLGLKLESRKAPVEVLVIDHVEEPSID